MKGRCALALVLAFAIPLASQQPTPPGEVVTFSSTAQLVVETVVVDVIRTVAPPALPRLKETGFRITTPMLGREVKIDGRGVIETLAPFALAETRRRFMSAVLVPALLTLAL